MGEPSDSRFVDLPLPAKKRIDAICARFEEAWRVGPADLEAFFRGVADDEQAALLTELLYLDIECRRRRGQSPLARDYLARFPGREALIKEILPEIPPDPPTRVDPGFVQPIPHMPAGGGSVAPRPRPKVPGYEVLEELGRGGMGIVYRARHLALNRMVALKFILSGRSDSPKHRERFRREAEVVARLRHPNIVQIYDIGEVEGQPYLALEYADGGSLRERLAGAPLEPRAAVLLLEPLTRAVQHAHRLGVIHRDLKPANILLAVGGDSVAEGNRQLPAHRPRDLDFPHAPAMSAPMSVCTPKLTDFGLAQWFGSDIPGSDPGMAAGTPSYMSPEQASGGTIGASADVWALGANLYELLTGRPPFRAATAIETLRLVLSTDPIPPRELQPSVPRDLDTICMKCLQKDPARRYANARQLAHDLRCYLTGEPISARPMGRLERTMKWVRRQPRTALLVAFVLMMALVGSIATLAMLFSALGWGSG